MDEQDVKVYSRESDPVTGRSGRTEASDYRTGFQREDYSDAHYEPVGESTVPPRYYTPPERTAREARPRHQKKAGGHTAAIICAILAAGLLGGACGAAWTGARLNGRLEALESSITAYETERQEAEAAAASGAMGDRDAGASMLAAGMNPADIYEQAKNQVVGIRTEVTRTNFFGMTSSGAVSGSGFLISDDGYIMTNFHVVEDAYNGRFEIEVMTYDGTKYSASIVGVEAQNDIAILKIEADGLNPAVFGNSDQLRVGDAVYAVGNPLGELEFSMSTGHVSALDRVINTKESESINMFQVDAAVNEGNSGGPVYDANGRVVGIVTAKYSSSGVEGLGFAIPINDAADIADDLITKGYVTGKAFMGVSLDNRYNSMYSQYYGMPLGAYIAEVTAGSAADRAGLRIGDIITAVGEYPVGAYDELKQALRHFSAFDSTEVSVYRAGEEIQVPITFDEATPENS
ncbi:MAG: trypsin-like peptidase domain-containing protein [Oscillospiraceae bacterium]|nr:trypsin-like peptidase domain-containing protein [Oscillospiraceae bacterium]